MKFFAFLIIAAALWSRSITAASAREVLYTGGEEVVYITPGEPTQIAFPTKVEGGYKKKVSNLKLEKQDNFLVVFADPALANEGEAIIVPLDDKRAYSLRIIPATAEHLRDGQVRVYDNRPPNAAEASSVSNNSHAPFSYAPPTIVSGLMREMKLVAEIGKRGGIRGYRRSNRYSGEQVLHDSSLVTTIDEIFMGENLWGYVMTAENLLDKPQRLNPATFKLDGTRAVDARSWELGPRPKTAEERIEQKNKTKIFVITRSKRGGVASRNGTATPKPNSDSSALLILIGLIAVTTICSVRWMKAGRR